MGNISHQSSILDGHRKSWKREKFKKYTLACILLQVWTGKVILCYRCATCSLSTVLPPMTFNPLFTPISGWWFSFLFPAYSFVLPLGQTQVPAATIGKRWTDQWGSEPILAVLQCKANSWQDRSKLLTSHPRSKMSLISKWTGGPRIRY